MMRDIYRSAVKVVAFIGEVPHDEAVATRDVMETWFKHCSTDASMDDRRQSISKK
jgi:hypothetical protein